MQTPAGRETVQMELCSDLFHQLKMAIIQPKSGILLPVAKRTLPGLFCTLRSQACDPAVLLRG